jgi:hypothetical protein
MVDFNGSACLLCYNRCSSTRGLSFEIKTCGQPYCCVRRTFVHGMVPGGGCLDLDPAPPHFCFYSWMYEFSSVSRLFKWNHFVRCYQGDEFSIATPALRYRRERGAQKLDRDGSALCYLEGQLGLILLGMLHCR